MFGLFKSVNGSSISKAIRLNRNRSILVPSRSFSTTTTTNTTNSNSTTSTSNSNNQNQKQSQQNSNNQNQNNKKQQQNQTQQQPQQQQTQSQQSQQSSTSSNSSQSSQQKKNNNNNYFSTSTSTAKPVTVEVRLKRSEEIIKQVETLIEQERYSDAENSAVTVVNGLVALNHSELTSEQKTSVQQLSWKAQRNLAFILQNTASFKESETIYKRLLEQTSHSELERALLLANMTEVSFHVRKTEGAKKYYDEALKLFGKLEKKSMAGSLMANWSIFLSMENKYQDAKVASEEALNLLTDSLGPSNEIISNTLQNLAVIYANLQMDIRDLEKKWADQLESRNKSIVESAIPVSINKDWVRHPDEDKFLATRWNTSKKSFSNSAPLDLDPPGLILENLTKNQQEAFQKQQPKSTKMPWSQ